MSYCHIGVQSRLGSGADIRPLEQTWLAGASNAKAIEWHNIHADTEHLHYNGAVNVLRAHRQWQGWTAQEEEQTHIAEETRSQAGYGDKCTESKAIRAQFIKPLSQMFEARLRATLRDFQTVADEGQERKAELEGRSPKAEKQVAAAGQIETGYGNNHSQMKSSVATKAGAEAEAGQT